jgi:hypothetical protein
MSANVPLEQQRHQQIIKVLAEIASYLKQIAQALEIANMKKPTG